MSRKEPRQKPGESRQDYQTPREFLDVVERTFGPLVVDLAAQAGHEVAPIRLGPERDSLSVDWLAELPPGNWWLNPPFGHITPWARKCADASQWLQSHGSRILMLSLASVGSCWFADLVFPHALVLPLRPRLTFMGETHPYPKDLMLSCFGLLDTDGSRRTKEFHPWRWDH